MDLLHGLAEDIVHIVSKESLLEALLAGGVYALADNTGLVDHNAAHGGAGYALSGSLSRGVVQTGQRLDNCADMGRSSSAAAAEDLHSGLCQLHSACGEFLGAYIICICNRVRQACVGLCDDREDRQAAQLLQHGVELIRAKGAVHTDSVNAQTLQHSGHALRGNSGEGAHILLKGHGDHNGLIGVLLCSKNSGLDLIQIGHCLDNDQVGILSSQDEFLEGVVGLLEFKGSGGLKELAYGTHIKGNEGFSANSPASVLHTGGDYLLNGMARSGQFIAVCAEGVCVNDVSAAFSVLTVNIHYSLGISEVEELRNVLGLDTGSLEHSSHASVQENEAVVLKKLVKFV